MYVLVLARVVNAYVSIISYLAVVFCLLSVCRIQKYILAENICMLGLMFPKFLLKSMRALLLNLIKAELCRYTYEKPSLNLCYLQSVLHPQSVLLTF